MKETQNVKDGTPQREGAQLDGALFHAVLEVLLHRQVEDKNPPSVLFDVPLPVTRFDSSVCRNGTYVLCGLGYAQVGTLDTLMQLSDDLVRIDMLVENMVHKIEKQYAEVAGETPETLKVSLWSKL